MWVGDALSDDHDRLGEILVRLAAELQRQSPESASLWAELKRGLEDHIRFEEQALFPAYLKEDPKASERQIESLILDHHRIESTLDDLGSAIVDLQYARGAEFLENLRIFLEGHNRDEEHGVYAEVDRHVRPSTRQKLLEEFKSICHRNCST